MTAAKSRHRAAVHEAAHAVAAVSLGRPVRDVTVLDNGGMCRIGLDREAPWTWVDAVQEATIALVGALAAATSATAVIEVPVAVRAAEIVELEARAICPGEAFDAVWDDEDLVERLLRGAAGCDQEADALMVVARCHAEALAASDRFRVQVGHMAELLYRDGRLDGESVRCEIERIDWRLRLAAESGN